MYDEFSIFTLLHKDYSDQESLVNNLTEFGEYLITRAKKPGTIKCYQSDLEQFELFCKGLNKTLLTADKDDIKQFLERDFSPATKRRKVSSLRVFYTWCIKRGYISEKPVTHGELDLPTVVYQPTYLSPGQEIQLFSHIIGDTLRAPRDKTLARLCRQGMQLQNILDFEMDSVNHLLVTLPVVEEDLLNYLSERQKKWPLTTETKIFLNKHGKPLSARSVRRQMVGYGHRAGISGVNPRILQNTFKEEKANANTN